jgi:hypothetical protein
MLIFYPISFYYQFIVFINVIIVYCFIIYFIMYFVKLFNQWNNLSSLFF